MSGLATRAMPQQLLGNATETSQAYTLHMAPQLAPPASAPLTGYRIAVTSANRAEELCALLRRNGAEVSSAAPSTSSRCPKTKSCSATPKRSSPGLPISWWRTPASASRLGRRGRRLGPGHPAAGVAVPCADRGPRAEGHRRVARRRAARGVVPKSESSREVLRYLLESNVAGKRIAVQLHGAADGWDPFPEFLNGLRSAGAQVVPIHVYRWKPTPAGGDFDQLVASVARRQFDAVTFTSALAGRRCWSAAASWASKTNCCKHFAATCTRCAWGRSPRSP